MRELARVTAPGGRIIIVTWCHRLSAVACSVSVCDGSEELHSALCAPEVVRPSEEPIALSEGKSASCYRACARRRVLGPGEQALEADEQALLDRICEAYYLPAWCSVADYQRLFEAEGLQVECTLHKIQIADADLIAVLCVAPVFTLRIVLCMVNAQGVRINDWSEAVSPFWGAVIRSALSAEGVMGLMKAGWTTVKARGAGLDGMTRIRHLGASVQWGSNLTAVHDVLCRAPS